MTRRPSVWRDAGRVARDATGGRSSDGSCWRIACSRRWSSGPGSRPELLDQNAARVLVGLERLGLAARAIEREHQLAPAAFAERLERDRRLELADQVGMPAERQIRFDAFFERDRPPLLQARRLPASERLRRKLAERWTPPERERMTEGCRRAHSIHPRHRRPCAFHGLLELIDVDRAGGDHECVAVTFGHQDAVAKRPPQLRDSVLKDLGGRRRRAAGPELLDQPVGRHRLVAVQEQEHQQRALAPRTDRYDAPSRGDLERPEYPIFHATAPRRRYRLIDVLWAADDRSSAASPYPTAAGGRHRKVSMSSKLTRAATLASVLALFATGAATSAQAQDLRSPDARDASSTASAPSVSSADLRSPDAVDAGAPLPAQPLIVKIPSSRGFDWDSAGIGAGGGVGVILIGLAGAFAVTHRPRQAAGR